MVSLLLLIVIYLSFISLGLPDSLLGSAWPSMYQSLKVPLHYAGIISMIVSGGTVVSSLCSARLIRRFGTGVVTAVSVCLTAAALAGFSLTRVFWALCLWAVPLGLGGGSVDAALNNYVALHYRARHMSWLHCFWGIGASTGPMIMSSFLMRGSVWNAGYRTISIIQFALVVLLFATLRLWKRSGPAETSAARGTTDTAGLFRVAGVKPALVAFFCYCSMETVTGLWGSSYLVMVKNIAPEIAARWVALYYIGITSGRFLAGFVTMKLDSRTMIRLGQGIIGIGVAALLLPFGNSTLLPGFFMIGLGCAPIYPGLLHETPENFGRDHSQAIMGIQMASAYVGTTLTPPLFGRLASFVGFEIFPLCIGLILILNFVMVETVNRKTARPGRP